MNDELFIFAFASFVTFILSWGFRVLPAEKWQFIAAVPIKKLPGGAWSGVNLTYYGFFSATAYLIAICMLFILLSSIGEPSVIILGVTLSILIPCVPASRIIARIIEKKAYTFSVQGATFMGIVIAPWMIYLTNRFLGLYQHTTLDVTIILAAMSTTNALGEGIGRLACISFGCCYGKPLHRVSPFYQKLFNHLYFIFTGFTKKIAYADHLEGERILPIQAVTAIIMCLTGIVGSYLFLKGFFVSTFLGVVIITQVWRFVSEFVRADHRGGGRISAYQVMSLIVIFYALCIVWLFPANTPPLHNLITGIKSLWNPAIILFLQVLWGIIFVFTGRSRVTSATLSFNIVHEHI